MFGEIERVLKAGVHAPAKVAVKCVFFGKNIVAVKGHLPFGRGNQKVQDDRDVFPGRLTVFMRFCLIISAVHCLHCTAR